MVPSTRSVYVNHETGEKQLPLVRAYARQLGHTGNLGTSILSLVAVKDWHEAGQVDTASVLDWFNTVENRDRAEKQAGLEPIRWSLYFRPELSDMITAIGYRIQEANIPITGLTAKAGFNSRLLISLAFERLARIVREQHPDLQPEQ